ncbi:MAG TPA: glycosyltransferase family 4 protein [Burkholderiaceae bacterium]|nr:glycosyltransferase family 4 protein [Burkholderiaceae bacterium]
MAKIVFVNRYYAPDESATSQMLTDLATHLAAAGAEVHIVTSQQLLDDPCHELPSEENLDGVTVHRVRTTTFGRGHLSGRAMDYLSFYLTAAMRLLRIADRSSIVVAKTDPPLISIVVAAVARLRGARTVNWLQDLFPEVAIELAVPLLAGRVGRLLVWMRDATARHAMANVVIGERMADRLRGRSIPSTTIQCIPNWADGVAIRPWAGPDHPLRTAWGLQGRFVIGYSGNMGRAHEFQTLLEAAERLRDEDRIVFLFIGAGQQRTFVEAEARRRGLSNIVFKPFQPRERLRESLTVPDVHVASLRPALEGLIVPSKFYGIAAAGRAVLFIGAASGELALQILRADCGSTVEPGDSTQIERLVRLWADSPDRVRVMGRNARRLFDLELDRRFRFEQWRRVLGAGADRN